MFAALLPLVLSLAPQLAGVIFGSKGGEAADQVLGIVKTVVGVDPTTSEGAAAAVAAIQGNPDAARELQTRLGELHLRMLTEQNREQDQQREDALKELQSRLTDVGSARSHTIALAGTNSPLAYGSMILSGFILIAFSIMLYVVLTSQMPQDNSALANVLLGTLAAMATQVANYWLGSSSGSAAKNSALAGAQNALANSVPVDLARSVGPSEPPGRFQ